MRQRLLFLLFFLLLSLLPLPAWAALAVDNTTVHDQDALADPIVFTHTTNAGANLLVVGCVLSGTTTITTMTYNGDEMTQDLEIQLSSTYLMIFSLVNPDIGSNQTISIDLSAVQDGGCYAISFSGADTVTPLTATTSTNSSGASTSSLDHTITCASGNIALGVGGISLLRTVTVATGTQIMNQDDGTGANWGARIAGAGASTTLSYTWTGGNATHHHAMTCVEAGAESPRRRLLLFQ